MLTLLFILAAFVGGVVIGALNPTTIDKAITTVETAERNAAATLSKITAHKTTTAVPATPPDA